MAGDKVVSVHRDIPAPAPAIFAVLADPARHADFDGSGTVRAARPGAPRRLQLGSRFSMDMRMGVPYRIGNVVVELEEDRRIAWRHWGRHVWRYRLEPLDEGTTRVTESFDWSGALFPPYIERARWPQRHEANMARSLERLERLVLDGSEPAPS